MVSPTQEKLELEALGRCSTNHGYLHDSVWSGYYGCNCKHWVGFDHSYKLQLRYLVPLEACFYDLLTKCDTHLQASARPTMGVLFVSRWVPGAK